jgi:hypothetical protein
MAPHPESLVIFQVQRLPVPLNGHGSLTSPRTSLDLNFDFQKALFQLLVAILWQPSIISLFIRSVKRLTKLFPTDSPTHQPLFNKQPDQRRELILPGTYRDFNPQTKEIFFSVIQLDLQSRQNFKSHPANHRRVPVYTQR